MISDVANNNIIKAMISDVTIFIIMISDVVSEVIISEVISDVIINYAFSQ